MPADLADLGAAEIARGVAEGHLTAVEVVEAALDRVTRFNGVLNAVVTLNPRALDDARVLDRSHADGQEPGLLAGVPVGIKDVTPVEGLRTTFGSPLYADHVPDEDALVVRRLRNAGAIILGKTNTPEFAAGGNTFNEVFGRTRNPWDPERSAGGSTGGGAAALASGMIALAEGTDLGGSLRIPASFCGLVGLRPSPGLVPTYPSDWLWDDLQVTGPMARTAEDVALMLQAVCGPAPVAPLAAPAAGRDFVTPARTGAAGPLRLAYCPDIVGLGIDQDIESRCREAAFRLIEHGHEVELVEVDLSQGRKAFLHLRGLWMVSHQYDRLERIDELGANVRGNVEAGLQRTTEELAWANKVRSWIWEFFQSFFQRYDHLLTPSMAVPPFPVEQDYPETVGGHTMKTYVDWLAPTFTLSLSGLPVASVPCGLDGSGLPVGLQIVGPQMGEERVLALAASVQQAFPIGSPVLDRLR
jgi:amidase